MFSRTCDVCLYKKAVSQLRERLTHCETIENLLAVCLYDNCTVVKISLLLLSLLSQDVTVISMLTLNFSCSSKRETLFCSGFSFNFWHFFIVLIINNVWQRIYQGVTHFFYSSLLAAANFSARPENGLLGLGPSASAAFLLSALAIASAASLSRLC